MGIGGSSTRRGLPLSLSPVWFCQTWPTPFLVSYQINNEPRLLCYLYLYLFSLFSHFLLILIFSLVGRIYSRASDPHGEFSTQFFVGFLFRFFFLSFSTKTCATKETARWAVRKTRVKKTTTTIPTVRVAKRPQEPLVRLEWKAAGCVVGTVHVCGGLVESKDRSMSLVFLPTVPFWLLRLVDR